MSESSLDLRYDQVSFVATHNSYTGYFKFHPKGAAASTQRKGIFDQLKMGVRFLQLDVYRNGPDDDFYCMHGDYFVETVPLSTCLNDIHKFMTESDRNAVIGIGIEPHVKMSDKKTVKDMLDAFRRAGLYDLMFNQKGWTFDQYQRWPTLRQMIRNNWRLVVFSEQPVIRDPKDAELERILYQYDYFVENVYDTPSISPPEWTCAREDSSALWATNRGLFLMNHFKNFDWHSLVDPFDIIADNNNSKDLDKQISELEALYLRTPNFINVNFFEDGHNGGPRAAADHNRPATRLLAPNNLNKRFEMTGNVFIEVKGRYNGQVMVVQLMDDTSVKIQPKKSGEPGQLWTPIFILGSAVGVAFVNVKKLARMYAISGAAENKDVKAVPFDPNNISDSIIWKNCERATSSEYTAIQYARDGSYNLNAKGSTKITPGMPIATWTWSDRQDNEMWRFTLAAD